MAKRARPVSAIEHEEQYERTNIGKHGYRLPFPYGKIADPCMLCNKPIQDDVHRAGAPITLEVSRYDS